MPGTREEACASGIAALDIQRTLDAMVGPAALSQAKARLTSEQRAELDNPTPYDWIRLTTLSQLFDAVACVVGREPEAFVDEMIRRAVEHTFKTVWRMFLRVTTDEALIKRTPVIYQRSRNVGQLESKLLGRGHAEVRLSGWYDVSDRQLRLLGISIQAILQIAGRRDVTFSHARTADGGRYEIRWRA